jgi:hypothetical protein
MHTQPQAPSIEQYPCQLKKSITLIHFYLHQHFQFTSHKPQQVRMLNIFKATDYETYLDWEILEGQS